jgi:glycosyltransferase involved in cell wall biosynthesis
LSEGDERSTLLTASIVIPYLNAEDTIAEQLSSIGQQIDGRAVEVIVVDNGSSAPSREYVVREAARHRGVWVVDGSAEPGAAQARNLGAHDASGELLIFVDADDVVAPGWLDAYLAEPPPTGLLAGAVDEAVLARYPAWGARTSRARPPRTMRGHVYAISANCAIGAALFESVGGFVPAPGGGVGEDVALSWTVERRGLPVRFVPGAVVLKRQRETRRGLLARWFRYGRSAPALERMFPERAGLGLVQSQWTRPRAEVTAELFDTLRHPALLQGPLLQLVGLVAGRAAGMIDGRCARQRPGTTRAPRTR